EACYRLHYSAFLSVLANLRGPTTAAARTRESNSNWTPYWLISALLKPTRSQPEPQLSGPGKADALDTAPAVPSSNDSRMAASRESLFSSRGGSPSCGPTS